MNLLPIIQQFWQRSGTILSPLTAGDSVTANTLNLTGNSNQIVLDSDGARTITLSATIATGGGNVTVVLPNGNCSIAYSTSGTYKAIDDFINQSVKTDASPTFDSATYLSGITLGRDSTVIPGTIKLWSSSIAGPFYSTFTAGNQTANATYTLPTAMPTATGLLKSTSAGVMSWDESAYLPIGGGTLTGNLLFTDNTLDIGLNATTNRPRDLFLSRNAVIGGQITIPFGSASAPSIKFSGGTAGIYGATGTNSLYFASGSTMIARFNDVGCTAGGFGIAGVTDPVAGGFTLGSTGVIKWQTTYPTYDLGLSKSADGTLAIGNGTAANASGYLIASRIGLGGVTAPTNNLSLPLDGKIDFGDNAVYIFSNDDGYLDLVANTGIRLSGATVCDNVVTGTYFQTSTAATANSTGTVAIVAKDANLLTNNAGWLPCKKSDGTVVYIPYWT